MKADRQRVITDPQPISFSQFNLAFYTFFVQISAVRAAKIADKILALTSFYYDVIPRYVVGIKNNLIVCAASDGDSIFAERLRDAVFQSFDDNMWGQRNHWRQPMWNCLTP